MKRKKKYISENKNAPINQDHKIWFVTPPISDLHVQLIASKLKLTRGAS